jgi:hypothetical protein
MIFLSAMESMMDRVERYRSTARQALVALLRETGSPRTLHRLRTHLRRLQAYLELAGEVDQARLLSDRVSGLSRLRTLHVFERYLTTIDAPAKDIRPVARCIAKVTRKVTHSHVYEDLIEQLDRLQIRSAAIPPRWMQERLRLSRMQHAEAVRKLIMEATAHPRRRCLHALRLRIKSIRYQEEWADCRSGRARDLLRILKHAQTVLGKYEERVQFTKLATKMELRSVCTVDKDRRRARKRARTLPSQLMTIVERLRVKAMQAREDGAMPRRTQRARAYAG